MNRNGISKADGMAEDRYAGGDVDGQG